MVRMTLHKEASYIEESDVIVLEERAIKFYERVFPECADLEYKLKILAQLFWYSPESRAESKKELDQKIRAFLKNPNITEEMLKKVFKDYIPIKLMNELERLENENERMQANKHYGREC